MEGEKEHGGGEEIGGEGGELSGGRRMEGTKGLGVWDIDKTKC